jgi:hypothetical protein
MPLVRSSTICTIPRICSRIGTKKKGYVEEKRQDLGTSELSQVLNFEFERIHGLKVQWNEGINKLTGRALISVSPAHQHLWVRQFGDWRLR